MAAEDAYVYSAIALLTLCSVITRAGYQLFGDYLPLSDGVRRALRYAPAAALTAIIVPDMLPWRPGEGPLLDMKLLAGVAATLVFLRTRSAVAVIVSGMLVLWGLRWLAP
nr:AzlD domain-containing protein [Bordetella genomosp. 9]